jgi:hypothetical protein
MLQIIHYNELMELSKYRCYKSLVPRILSTSNVCLFRLMQLHSFVPIECTVDFGSKSGDCLVKTGNHIAELCQIHIMYVFGSEFG